MRPACGCSFFYFVLGHMGKNSGNPDLMSEKNNASLFASLSPFRYFVCYLQ